MTQSRCSCAEHAGRDSWSAGLQGQTGARWNQSPTEPVNKDTGCPENVNAKITIQQNTQHNWNQTWAEVPAAKPTWNHQDSWHSAWCHTGFIHSQKQLHNKQSINQHPAISLLSSCWLIQNEKNGTNVEKVISTSNLLHAFYLLYIFLIK